MLVYLLRHGETDWNLEHRAQGQVDIPLNATGIRQAEELKEKIKSYTFDICYCSPLKRAVQTAKIITDDHIKIIYDDNLKERSFGYLEGVIVNSDGFNEAPNTKKGGIEPIQEVFARSKQVLDRIKAENPPEAKVLVVAHGVLLKTMHFNIVGYDSNTDLHSFHFKNGDIFEYDI